MIAVPPEIFQVTLKACAVDGTRGKMNPPPWKRNCPFPGRFCSTPDSHAITLTQATEAALSTHQESGRSRKIAKAHGGYAS